MTRFHTDSELEGGCKGCFYKPLEISKVIFLQSIPFQIQTKNTENQYTIAALA